ALRWLDVLGQDLRIALRGFRKNEAFALTAMLTLALGIGASTLIFSIIDCVLLHPYPYKNADRLAIFMVYSGGQTRAWPYPVSGFLDFKEENHTFEDMVGLYYRDVRYSGPEGADEFFGGWVTPDAFDFLGVQPLLGRSITTEDAKPGAPPVFVMSYRLWSKRFRRDPSVLGTTQTLNATPMTLIGIMPPRFQFGECETWMPLALTRHTILPVPGVEEGEVWVVGHLKRGVSPQAATADLQVIAKRLENAFPLWFPPGFKLAVTTLVAATGGDDFRLLYFVLFG